jgi:tetratricopeptide (TPR) repeat protein
LLRAGLQQFPQSIELRTDLGFVLLQQGQFEPAATEIKKVLKVEERNLRAMQLLAQVYLAEKKLELAKMVLDNAAAIEPKDPQTHNAQGMLHLALKMRPAALEDFKQAVALNPEFIEARNNLGALLNETQDYGAAVQQLQEAVLIAPDFAAARLNLGNAYRGQRQYAKAADEYKRVLQLKPDMVDAYYNLAILNLDSELPQTDPIERLKTAIAYFDQYRSRGGKDLHVDAYLKDANKGIEKEQRRRDRERKEQLKKTNQAAVSSQIESKPGINEAAPTKSPSAKIDSASRSGPPR